MVYERARRLRSPPMIAWCSSTSRPTLFARDLPIRAWSPLSKSCRYTNPGPVGRMGCSHRHHAIWNPPSWSLFALFAFASTFLLCRCGSLQPTTSPQWTPSMNSSCKFVLETTSARQGRSPQPQLARDLRYNACSVILLPFLKHGRCCYRR